MLRSVLAVLVGWMVGCGVNIGVILTSTAMYPHTDEFTEASKIHQGSKPDDVDEDAWKTKRDAAWETMRVEFANVPLFAMLLVLLAHAGGTFAGCAACVRIARRGPLACAMVIGVMFLLGGMAMLTIIPAPTWLAVTDLVLYLPAAWLGYRLCRRPLAVSPPEPAVDGTS